MGDIFPDSESLRRAVKWISEQLKENNVLDKKKLVNEANFRFNLSPKDADFLMHMYRDNLL